MKKLLALVAILGLTASACNHQQRVAAKDAAIECAHQDLGQTIPEMGLTILMYVVGLIFQGPPGYEDKLAQVGKDFGPEALKCAEHVAEQLFRPAPDATPSTGDGIETPHDRAVKALGGVTFK